MKDGGYMSNIELLKHINTLRDKSENNKLIAFVGAGVSQNVTGMPSWSALIKAMAESIGYSKCDTCKFKKESCEKSCNFRYEFSTDEFLKIPQYVSNKDKMLYDKVITDNISDVIVDAPLSKAIFEINPAHIITTNYDTLLENSTSVFCEQYEVIFKDCHLLNSNKNKYIIKMHGDINHPETIILKERDYLDYSQNHVLIEMFMKSLLTDHTLIFLGYSLNDYNIKLIISWLNYIKAQNNVITAERKVGYIVLDDEMIDENKLTYFESNNIGVINVNKMPIINNVPTELTNERGKRLYSFLNVISNASLEGYLGYDNVYNNAVEFMTKYRYVSCDQICSFLQIKRYRYSNGELVISFGEDYNNIVDFLNTNSTNAEKLKQLMVNANILSIVFYNSESHKKEKYILNGVVSVLYSNLFYNLYQANDYVSLKNNIDTSVRNIVEKCFYESLVDGYSSQMISSLEAVDANNLSSGEKIAYLFNYNSIVKIKTFKESDRKAKTYINNVATTKEKEILKPYLDIYDGNDKKLSELEESLRRLKSDYLENNQFINSNSLGQLYNIKKIAINEYMFYFANNLFFAGYIDLKKILRYYIEAIMCTNEEFYENSNNNSEFESSRDKYIIDSLDIDIITKFISSKDLYNLIAEYKVNFFEAEEKLVDIAICRLKNIANSIVKLSLYGVFSSAVNILMNCLLLLSHMKLSKKQVAEISEIIVMLLNDSLFQKYFFSIRSNEWRTNIKILSNIVAIVQPSVSFGVIKSILLTDSFFDYYTNINSARFSLFVKSLIKADELSDIQGDIYSITSELDDNKKILALQILQKYVIDEKLKSEYKKFLVEHFSDLNTNMVLNLVFSDWLDISERSVKELFNKTIALKQQDKGIKFFPDQLDSNLELLYILNITGRIETLEPLKELSDTRPHLQFLINSDDFDYTQVDFSDYMWENFVRHRHLRVKFIEHKDVLIPILKKKIELGQACECDRKMLYGFLLDKEEII